MDALALVDQPPRSARDWCLTYPDRRGKKTAELRWKSTHTRREMLGHLAVPRSSLEDGSILLCRGEKVAPPDFTILNPAWVAIWQYW